MPTQPAILGSMRLGNFRLGYRPAALIPVRTSRVLITLAGVGVRTRIAGLTIHNVINDSPDTCTLTIDGSETPVPAQRLRIAVNADAPRLLFNGALQTVDLTYEGRPGQLAYPCSATDDLADLNRRRPFGTWTNVSATTIAQAIVATFAPGFSAAGIAPGLPLVSVNLDGSEGFSGALNQLAKLIGGYFKTEDFVVYLFTDDTSDPPDAIDDTPGRFLDDPPITLRADDSQLRTRVYGRGHNEATLSDVAAGETIVPVANAGAWFGTIGGAGQAISDTQRLAYTGVQAGGLGTLIGPGVTPSVKLSPALTLGSGLTLGDHLWAYTWVTASGETLPSPLSAVLTARVYTPPTPAQPFPSTQVETSSLTPTLVVGASYAYKAVWTDASGTAISLESPASAPIVAIARFNDPTKTSKISVPFDSGVPGTDPLVRQILFYRSENGGPFLLAGFVITGSTNQFDDVGGSFGTPYPGSASQTFAQASLAGIAIGPTGTTARKVYQTAAGGSQLKLQQTIANNSATTATASLADGSLGANAPTADTSALPQPTGQINAGSASVLTAGSSGFSPTGGWAINGQQALRYTGLSGNTLTGIPPTGPGAIVSTMKYNEHLDPAPALTGVTGIVVPLLKGAPVHIWVQRDDLAAQAEQAIVDAANGRVPADGIYEGPILSNENRGEASLIAVCDATLALFSRPIQTVTYACRDLKSKSGKTVHIDVTTPPIGPFDLTIQDVTIDQIDVAVGTWPRFSVTASTVRFSLEDLLRRMAAATGA